MKRFLATLLSILMLASLLTACGGKEEAPAAKEETKTEAPAAKDEAPAELPSYTLKFGHGNAPEHAVSIAAQAWADAVAEKTDGRITIEVYPAGQLGSLEGMMEMVSLGTLDICLGDISMMGAYLPKTTILAQPFMISNYDHAAAVVDGEIGEAMFNELADASNLRVLGVMWNGFRNLATQVPIETVADCAGIDIRSPDLDVYLNLLSTLGMNPIPIAWGEAYTAISTGVADAIEDSPEALYTDGFHRYLPYMTTSNHICSLVGPTIREDLWTSMSAEDQALLQECLDEAIAEQRASTIENEDKFYSLLEEDGVTVTEFKDRAKVIELFTPMWKEFAEEADCVAELEAIIALS